MNILVTDDLCPKIIDFSLSRYESAVVGEIKVHGTPNYLATEIKKKLKQKTLTLSYDAKKADLFSLGLTLLEFFHNKFFSGYNIEGMRYGLDEAIDDVPFTWGKIIVKILMDPIPEKRLSYAGALELLRSSNPNSLISIKSN